MLKLAGGWGRCSKPPPLIGARGKVPENFQILHPPYARRQHFTFFFTEKKSCVSLWAVESIVVTFGNN